MANPFLDRRQESDGKVLGQGTATITMLAAVAEPCSAAVNNCVAAWPTVRAEAGSGSRIWGLGADAQRWPSR